MLEPLHIHVLSEKENEKEMTEITRINIRAKKHPIIFINEIVRQEGVTLNERIWNQLEKIVEKNCKW